jgi:hypothetical protein
MAAEWQKGGTVAGLPPQHAQGRERKCDSFMSCLRLISEVTEIVAFYCRIRDRVPRGTER